MATEDCPGYGKASADVLAQGCWAAHEDGSLIYVYSTEGGRVIYSLFDLSQDPAMDYRDAMQEAAFKKAFSWKSGEAVLNEKWTWHDKTVFPWDKVIAEGVKPGVRYASAADQLSAARRVAEALHLRAAAVDPQEIKPRQARRIERIARRLEKALGELGA